MANVMPIYWTGSTTIQRKTSAVGQMKVLLHQDIGALVPNQHILRIQPQVTVSCC